MMIVENANTTAIAMVNRSRFFSATVDPAAAEPTDDPNMSDNPPPRPLWSKIKTMSAKEERTSTPTMTSVSTGGDLQRIDERAPGGR